MEHLLTMSSLLTTISSKHYLLDGLTNREENLCSFFFPRSRRRRRRRQAIEYSHSVDCRQSHRQKQSIACLFTLFSFFHSVAFSFYTYIHYYTYITCFVRVRITATQIIKRVSEGIGATDGAGHLAKGTRAICTIQSYPKKAHRSKS